LLGILGTFAAFGTAAWLVGVHLTHGLPRMSGPEIVEFLCWEVALLGVTVLCAVLFVALACGPPTQARRKAVSEELPLFFAMLCGTAFASACEIRFVRALSEGTTDSIVGVLIVMAMFGVVWLLCASACLAAARTLIVRGRSRLELLQNPLASAEPLTAVLEIPYSPGDAPTVTAELRCDCGTADAEFSREWTVWSDSRRIDAWEPVGQRRSRATIEFALPESVRVSGGCGGPNFNWVLHAKSETAAAPFSAVFLVPVEFA